MTSYRDNAYMITCPARTGSTMLVHLLRSHPEICSHGEVFAPGLIRGLAGSYLLKDENDPDFIQSLTRERDRDPVRFLYKIVLDLQGRKVASFKLKHEELVRPEDEILRRELVGDTDFRIIHLRRENLLLRYLSHYIASQVTHVTLALADQSVPTVGPVTLDPQACDEDFTTVLAREAEFAELFKSHPSYSISYEELVRSDKTTIQGLLNFLSVSNVTLTTVTRKLAHQKPREAIQNFDALKEYFSGSVYEVFFEEP